MAYESGNSPHYRCQSYNDQFWDWKLVNDVYKGTRWMRLQSTVYLPQEPAESSRAYAIRRNKAILYNALKQTVRGLTGMVFKRDPSESSDIPTKIYNDMDDIDLAGTNFNVFCKDAFKLAARDGHCFILIDHQEEDPNIVSRYDEERSGRRPYWLLFGKNQIVNWRISSNNGQIVLEQVTIEEEVYEPDGKFGEIKVKQWRVLKRGSWEIYRVNPGVTAITGPSPVKRGLTSLDFIPLVPVYCNKTAYFASEPPLLDLAHLNVRHFQIYSDYGHILHVANVPILWFVGRQKSNQQEIGPNAGIDLDEGGQMGFAEHTGSAIGGARTEIMDLEERMNLFGLMMLAPKESKAAPTATQTVTSKSNQMSVLSEMASSFKDCIDECLWVHGSYYDLPDGGRSNIIKDFDRLILDPTLLQIYISLVKENKLSVESLWELMAASDLLLDTFDPKVERERIQKDIKDGLTRMKLLGSELQKPPGDDNGGGSNNDPSLIRPRTGPESFGQAGAS